MGNAIKSVFTHVVMLTLIIQLAGCGTFIYPERQGQRRGDIDPAVAILDGVGLLFFVIPGLVAFIIDFHTGAIYLPPGKSTKQRLKELKGSDIRFLNEDGKIVVYFDRNNVTPEKIEQLIRMATGVEFDSGNPALEVYTIDSISHSSMQFERFATSKGGSALIYN